jgi:hypothetical protein
MTNPKSPEALQRPRGALGRALRQYLFCPLCTQRELRVVAYRSRTTRLECRACQFRFSVDVVSFVEALLRRPEVPFAANAEGFATLSALLGLPQTEETAALLRQGIQRQGVDALEGHFRATGRWEAFAEGLGIQTFAGTRLTP